MIGSGVISAVCLGLSVLLQTARGVGGDAGSWAMPVAYVAAVVFVVIILAAVYLILSALRQRQREDAQATDPAGSDRSGGTGP